MNFCLLVHREVVTVRYLNMLTFNSIIKLGWPGFEDKLLSSFMASEDHQGYYLQCLPKRYT